MGLSKEALQGLLDPGLEPSPEPDPGPNPEPDLNPNRGLLDPASIEGEQELKMKIQTVMQWIGRGWD